ncbi:MAG: rubredoxin [Lentisphaeria bacterium]|nr:rubredoxin [Lentisphaeria bacterium]
MTSLQVFSAGGLYAVNDLNHCAYAAYKYNQGKLKFGYRQNIIIDNVASDCPEFKSLNKHIQVLPADTNIQNVACSQDIGGLGFSHDWAYDNESYQELVSQFYKGTQNCSIQFSSTLPVTNSPFASDINLITSEKPNHWQCIIKTAKRQVLFPGILISSDIKELVLDVEQRFKQKSSLTDMDFAQVYSNHNFQKTDRYTSLSLPRRTTRLSHGFIPMQNGEWALNILSTDNSWDWKFINRLTVVAKEQHLGRFYITPQPSILIKHIKGHEIPRWTQILAEYNFPMAYGDNDLLFKSFNNISLRNKLAQAFNDAAVYAHNVRITSNVKNFELDAEIFIEEISGFFSKKYRVYYRTNLDIRELDIQVTERPMKLDDLCQFIIKLMKQHHHHTPAEKLDLKASKSLLLQAPDEGHQTYACKACLTEYIEDLGDPETNTKPGTLFNDLPQSWCCPTCEEPKQSFELVGPV